MENSHLFDDMALPDGCDRDNIIENILEGCSEFDCIYPYPDKMQQIIRLWSNGKVYSWQRMFDVIHEKYTAIYNKDVTIEEKGNRKNTGTNTVTDSGIDTNTNKGSVTNKVTGYNKPNEGEPLLIDSDQAVNDLTNQITYGKTTTTTPDLHEHHNFTRREFGNQGVTRSDEMVSGEVSMRSNIIFTDIIVQAFRDKFCVCLY